MFNPACRISQHSLPDGRRLIVVDDALAAPRAWVERACRHAEDFDPPRYNAYPGLELRLPDAVSSELQLFFACHARAALGARRTLRAYSRLAMATLAPERLSPAQWIPHRDRIDERPGLRIAACVLYLFEDPGLGGTVFFRPRVSESEIARLVHDSGVLAPAEFSRRYGIEPGYPRGDARWFEPIGRVEPRFNRLVFYDGLGFHCGEIGAPERLSADPAKGRLTLTAFFSCTASAA